MPEAGSHADVDPRLLKHRSHIVTVVRIEVGTIKFLGIPFYD
jgi:hypothetical protein